MQQNVILSYYQNHPIDAAKELQQYDIKFIAEQIAKLPQNNAVKILNQLPLSVIIAIMSLLTDGLARQYIQNVSIDKLSVLLHRLPSTQKERIKKYMPKQLNTLIKQIQENFANHALGIMKLNFTAVLNILSLDEAKNIILRSEQIPSHIWVINENKTLIGSVSLKNILTGKKTHTVQEITKKFSYVIPAQTTIGQVTKHNGWRENTELPVVDHNHQLLGVISITEVYSVLSGQALFEPLSYITHSADMIGDAVAALLNIQPKQPGTRHAK